MIMLCSFMVCTEAKDLPAELQIVICIFNPAKNKTGSPPLM